MSKVKTCSIRDEKYPHRSQGITIIDSNTPLLWTQEPQDRMGAVQMHENHCQIAEAIKRSHPEIDQVWIKASRIVARYQDGTYVKWEMSARVKKLLRNFDEGGRIPDGEYRANAVGANNREENMRKTWAGYKARIIAEGRPETSGPKKVLTTR